MQVLRRTHIIHHATSMSPAVAPSGLRGDLKSLLEELKSTHTQTPAHKQDTYSFCLVTVCSHLL